jgi:hypothetical protein
MKKALTIFLLLAASIFGTLVVAEARESSQLNPAQAGSLITPALFQGAGVGIVRGRRRARRMRRRARRRMRRRALRLRRNQLRIRGGIGRTSGRR